MHLTLSVQANQKLLSRLALPCLLALHCSLASFALHASPNFMLSKALYRGHACTNAVGVEDVGVQSAVAMLAVQLAEVVRQRISDGALFYQAYLAPYSTKSWHSSGDDVTCAADSAIVARSCCTCELVVAAFQLFQSLTVKANQAGDTVKGAEILDLSILGMTAWTFVRRVVCLCTILVRC